MGGKKKQIARDKWKVLITTTLIQSVIGGVVESYGAFFVPMMNNVFKDDSAKTTKAAFIGSLASGFQLGFSPVSSWMSEKIGPLIVAVFGGITVFLATFSASFARDFVSMALTYGICLGIGCSLLFITNNIIISQHFGEESTLAFGLLGFGNGVMNSVMPHIIAYAVERITLYGAIRTISLILSPLMFLPFYWKVIEREESEDYMSRSDATKSESTYRKKSSTAEVPDLRIKISHRSSMKNNNMIKRPRKKKTHENFYSRQMWQREVADYDTVILRRINMTNRSNAVTEPELYTRHSSSFEFVESSETSVEAKKPRRKLKDLCIVFQNKGFLNLCCAMLIASLGYQVPNVHMVNYSNDLNLYGNAQILLTCLGGASAVGPLVNPLFIDKFEEHISKFRIFQIFVMIYGLAVLFLPLVTNFNVLMIVCILIGYADGSFSTLSVPLIIDLVGTEKAGQCIGIYYGSISVSVTIAAPLAGYIYSIQNSYTPAFYAAGIFLITGGLLLSLTHKNIKYVDPKKTSAELATVYNSQQTPLLTVERIDSKSESNNKESEEQERPHKAFEYKNDNARRLSKID